MIKTKVLIAAMLAAQLVSSAVCAAETGGVGISADIKSDMCLISDSKYCESILLPAGTIKFRISVTNGGETRRSFTPYIAEYDSSGKLTSLKQETEISVNGRSVYDKDITCTFSSASPSRVKVMLWENRTFKPIHSPISIKVTAEDNFSDSFSAADKLNLDKPLCGVINTDSDVDIIKICPSQTGLYAMSVKTNPTAKAVLYDSNRNVLKETSQNDEYIFYNLAADSDYYIGFSGKASDSYALAPMNRTDATAVLKNIGQTAALSAGGCNVYSFTPDEDGTYIFTATDSLGVKAVLYDENFAYISSGRESDEDVSFRITGTMTANKTYYILTSGKTGTEALNYTLYAEQPLDIVSVS